MTFLAGLVVGIIIGAVAGVMILCGLFIGFVKHMGAGDG